MSYPIEIPCLTQELHLQEWAHYIQDHTVDTRKNSQNVNKADILEYLDRREFFYLYFYYPI